MGWQHATKPLKIYSELQNPAPSNSVLCISHIPLQNKSITVSIYRVGPCHHGIARPHVADGGTASNIVGSFK